MPRQRTKRPAALGGAAKQDYLEQMLTEAADRLLAMEPGTGPPLSPREHMLASCMLDVVSSLADDSEDADPAVKLAQYPPYRNSLLSILAAAVRLVRPHGGNQEDSGGGTAREAGVQPGVNCASSSDVHSATSEGSAASAATSLASGAADQAPAQEPQQPSRRGASSGPSRPSGASSSTSGAADRPFLSYLDTRVPKGRYRHIDQVSEVTARRMLCKAALTSVADILKRPLQDSSARPPDVTVDFARRVLRTQALHCCSRQLAAVAAVARPCLQAAAAAGWAGQMPKHACNSGGGRPAPPAYAAQAKAAVGISKRYLGSLTPAISLLYALARVAAACAPSREQGAKPNVQERAFLCELGAALRESCVVEHAALGLRTALPLSQLAAAAPDADGKEDDDEGTNLYGAYSNFCKALSCLHNALECCVADHGAQGDGGGSGLASSPVVTALGEVLAGPCVTYMMLAQTVRMLSASDGGPTYGMPGIMKLFTVIVAWPFTDEQTGTEHFSPSGLAVVIGMLRSPQRGMPPGRRGSVELLLRLGRAAVASARVWTTEEGLWDSDDEEEEGEEEEENDEEEDDMVVGNEHLWFFGAETVSAGGSGRSNSGPSDGADVRDGSAGSPAEPELDFPVPGMVVERDAVAGTACRAIRAVDELLAAAPRPRPDGWAAAAAAERWRLAVGAARYATPHAAPEELRELGAALRLEATWEESIDRPLPPPRPPPPLSAALAGGLLPCLERLLRRINFQDPKDRAATVLNWALTSRTDGRRMALLQLLFHHPSPAAAAALVASFAKALRVLVPLLVRCFNDKDTDGEDGGWAFANAQAVLCAAANAALAAFRKMDARRGAPSDLTAAERQPLVRIVSYIVYEWLPPMSYLVQQAALRSPVAFEMRVVECRCLMHALYCLLEWLPAGICGTGRQQDDDTAAAAAAAPDSQNNGADNAPGKSGVGADSGSDADSLPGCLTRGLGVVPLLGAMLRLVTCNRRLVLRSAWVAQSDLMQQMSLALHAAARVCAREVRLGAVAAAVAAARGAARAPSAEPARAAGAAAEQLSYWPPELLRCVAGDMRAAGLDGEADVVVAIAEQVGLWMLGAAEGAESGHFASIELRQDIKNAVGSVRRLLLTPSEARSLLRGCGNPGCTNMAGDSEAELPLKGCAGCGVVGYCCRECQTAHWRAGHKAACAGRRR